MRYEREDVKADLAVSKRDQDLSSFKEAIPSEILLANTPWFGVR